ncbi:PLC-like phosphodiesterase [Syncephalis pseudoplumigaleata]|uniref:glycerophosphodiester phosphodiesterase n=1 Tax=Syncephalis pseudoplumigaleata TaxID=1712513 RepID=A0A4P9Z224_9FUNG|nr:PLC-like phosphodiesterase [Syncephalis pseudoplumigaleata]|eukprot:RKP26022.1 PLC-like phosphodiesterase [Syncephalis pseudoplumigaleata]
MARKATFAMLGHFLVMLAVASMTGIQAATIPEASAMVPTGHQTNKATTTTTPTPLDTPSHQPAAVVDEKDNDVQASAKKRDTHRATIASQVADYWAHHTTKLPDIVPPSHAHWPNTFNGNRTLLFAHRGARAFMPAHSVGAYYLAAMLQADYIEPDLVLTKDGHVVCHHDLFLSEDTDVAEHPEFANRRRQLVDVLEGQEVFREDWYIEDFTLDELKTLRLRQVPIGARPLYFDDDFSIITFEEFLNLVQEASVTFGRPISIVPELKHVPHHSKLHHKQPHFFEDRVLSILTDYGYPLTPKPGLRATRDVGNSTIELGDVLLQSFEKNTIQYLRHRTALPLLYLIESTNIESLTPKGLDEMVGVATHIGVDQRLLFMTADQVVKNDNATYDAEHVHKLGDFIPHTHIPKEVHRRHLRLAAYAVSDSREGSTGLPHVPARVTKMFQMGVDAIFSENLAETTRLRDAYAASLTTHAH